MQNRKDQREGKESGEKTNGYSFQLIRENVNEITEAKFGTFSDTKLILYA